MLDYDANAATDYLSISYITVDKSSIIRDATVFNIKGTVNQALNFDYIALDSSSFGEGASSTDANIFIKLNGDSGTLTSM